MKTPGKLAQLIPATIILSITIGWFDHSDARPDLMFKNVGGDIYGTLRKQTITRTVRRKSNDNFLVLSQNDSFGPDSHFVSGEKRSPFYSVFFFRGPNSEEIGAFESEPLRVVIGLSKKGKQRLRRGRDVRASMTLRSVSKKSPTFFDVFRIKWVFRSRR